MSQTHRYPEDQTSSPRVPRSPWIDGTLAAVAGAGYGLALFNSPTTWLLAVVLLIVAAALYAFLVFRFVRLGGGRPDPTAQRTHGVRLLVLFALAYLLTRLDPAQDWRWLHAVGGGLLVGLGGFVVLRLEERARGRARVSAGDDRIGT